MINAQKVFNDTERERVVARIASLEERTDAEVVCGVATESARYDRAESMSGLLFALLALAFGGSHIPWEGWGEPVGSSFVWQAVLVVAGFVSGSVLTSYYHPLRRLFVLKRDMAVEVRRSAHQVFSQHGVGELLHRGGLLIYLSLFERRLEIRCDSLAAAALSDKDLESIRDAVLSEVRLGRIAEGLLAGLEAADALLAEALPKVREEAESLPNELLLFHPRP